MTEPTSNAGNKNGVIVTGEVGVEFVPDASGYSICGPNAEAPCLEYSRDNYESTALPAVDLSFGIGYRAPIALGGKLKLAGTIGPYLTFTGGYQSNAVYTDSVAGERERNMFSTLGYGADANVALTYELTIPKTSVTIPIGPFFDYRLGGLHFYNPARTSGDFTDGAFYVTEMTSYSRGDPKANPLVSQIGGGIKAGPLSLGYYHNLGFNTDFANLGAFERYDGDGNEVGAENASFKGGVDAIPASINPLKGGDNSVMLQLDVIAAGKTVIGALKKSSAKKKESEGK